MKKKNNSQNQLIIYKIIWANIKKYQYINELSDNQLAIIFDVSLKTLYNYDKDPSKITLEKIQNFADELNLPIEKIISM